MPSQKERKRRLFFETRTLPDKPGVYLMKDSKKRIIYVGKAKSIRKRVRSYFLENRDAKTGILMEHTEDIDTIITHNEYEALLLENGLIKQWNPRFNINLKDGKSYPVIRITNEEFPRVFRTRRIFFDGSLYFGPFPSVSMLDQYLNLIEKLFPLRKCRGMLKTRKNPCLYFHMNRCSAPCCGYISRDEYLEIVDKIRKLLSGEIDALIRDLRERMDTEAGRLSYESAARLRDQIRAIEEFTMGQQIVDFNEEARDYLGYAYDQNYFSFVILQMRGGSLAGKELFQTEAYSQPGEALGEFILQYYRKAANPPSTLFIAEKINTADLSAYLTETMDRTVVIGTPRDESHRKILQMAEENAREDILVRSQNRDRTDRLKSLKEALGLRKLPRRIEGFDVAHLEGRDTVASLVSFYNGIPEKNLYRRFKLRTLKGKIDDYEALRETVARRYTRVLNENLDQPDLILVDGGKGQVNAVFSILKSLDMTRVPLVGLAKGEEKIFTPQGKEPLILEEGSPALRLLQSVRDESHRFATGYHKSLRAGRLNTSGLERVKGIGRVRSRRLLEEFGSIEAIKSSSMGDLIRRAGLPEAAALNLIAYLRDPEEKVTS